MTQSATTNMNQESTCLAGGFPLLWTAFSLVPEALIEDENPDLWLNFLRERVPHAQVISSVPFEPFHLVCLFESKQARQHVIPYILTRACERETSDGVFAIRETDRLALVCIQNGQLQLGNIYEASTKEQTLYWILKAYEVLHLSATTPITIQCGEGTRKLLSAHLNVLPF